MIEEWRPVRHWPEYEVSNLGRIKRVSSGKILAVHDNGCGYPKVKLKVRGRVGHLLVHRIVAFTFLGVPPPGMEVGHDDNNRGNPQLSNLEWVTRSKNLQHSYDTGRRSKKGEKSSTAKLSSRKVRVIRSTSRENWEKLATRYGVTMATIRSVARRATWTHI
jgi:hypothetical protein